ncbi:MAG TPA: rhomboid family intramembrane serine protease [Opitutales bacterium]|mgnify:CR=1 FL=1|nr:rhomboid family intramembrane serine protease [Opitutales bacterium]
MYGDDSYEDNGFLTPAVKWILTANAIVFFAQFLRGPFMEYWFALWPNLHSVVLQSSHGDILAINSFKPWQLVSYGFLHSTATYTHIVFNMLALWMFGQDIERALGTRRFTLYYFVCVVGAAITHLVFATITHSFIPVIGASGGIFGLLLAYGILFPRNNIYIMFLPIPIEARFLVIIYGLLEVFSGLSATRDGVAHFAHLGGMIFGFFMIQYWRGRFPFTGRGRFPPLRNF